MVSLITHAGNCSLALGVWSAYTDFEPLARVQSGAPGGDNVVSLAVEAVNCAPAVAAALTPATAAAADGTWCVGVPLDVQVVIESPSTCSLVYGSPSFPIASPATPFDWGALVGLLLPLLAAILCTLSMQGSTLVKKYRSKAATTTTTLLPPRVVYIGANSTLVDGTPLDFPPPPPGLYYAGYEEEESVEDSKDKDRTKKKTVATASAPVQRLVYVYDPHGRLAHLRGALPAELLLPPRPGPDAPVATARYAARRAALLQEAAAVGASQPLRLLLPPLSRPLPRSLLGPTPFPAASPEESEADGSRSLVATASAAKRALAALAAPSRAARVSLAGETTATPSDALARLEEQATAAEAAAAARKLAAVAGLGGVVTPLPVERRVQADAAAPPVAVANPLRTATAAAAAAAAAEPEAAASEEPVGLPDPY